MSKNREKSKSRESEERKPLNLKEKSKKSISRYLSNVFETDFEVEKIEYDVRNVSDDLCPHHVINLYITSKKDKSDE